MTPSFMMMIRSASLIASSKSWVMNRIVFCSKFCRRRNSFWHLAPDERVEGGERLVEEPELGPYRERAGNAHSLLLAA